MNISILGKWSPLYLAVTTVLACSLAPTPATNADTNEIPGISGMAPLTGNSYLMVQDTKAHKKGHRTGILTILDDGPNSYKALDVDVLDKGDDRASDLEALHIIPGKPGHFLAAESGRRDLGPGRIFHLAYDEDDSKLSVIGDWPVATRIEKPMEWGLGKGDNYEGLVCIPLDGERYQLVLGERGRSKAHARGALITGILDLGEGTLAWQPASTDLELSSPGRWINPKGPRDIGDLWYDERDQSIWTAATEDPGDQGPFRSVLWQACTVGELNQETGLRSLIATENPTAAYTIDGHKIEGISAAPNSVPHAYLSVGAEDEDYGGTWRGLYPSVD